MKCDLSKVWAFVTSKKSENHTRLRSASIACARDAICQETGLLIHKGETDLGKQTVFPNNVPPRRRKSQPEVQDRSQCISGTTVCGQRGRFAPFFRNLSTERKIAVNREHLSNNFNVMEGFEIEDIQVVWNTLKERSIFSETRIQDGYLTTTLCSTEL